MNSFVKSHPSLAAIGVASSNITDDATRKMLDTTIEIARLAGIYFGAVAVIFIVLMFIGRLLKRRLSLPFGWRFRILCLSLALYLPTLSPFVSIPGRRHLGALVIITAAFALNRLIRHYLFDVRRKNGEGAQVPKLFGDIVSATVIIGTIFAVLQIAYGVKVPGLLAGAGIIGLVLGLALQDTLGNIFSGFAIYFGGQFKAGDWLLVDGRHAKIEEINWRSTRLRTDDGIRLDIPNNAITKQTVVNFTSPTGSHGMRMEIGLDYDSPPGLVKTVLLESALDCPYVLRDPEPDVFVKRLGDWSVLYELRYWLKDHGHYEIANSQINAILWHSLKRNGIQIPPPVRPQPQPDHVDSSAESFIREALKHSLLAKVLPEAALDGIAERSRIVHFSEGETIIRRGTDSDAMFILIQGHAEVQMELKNMPAQPICLEPGACIGEIPLLAGEPHGTSIRAAEDCTAVEIPRSALAPALTANPTSLEKLSELLTRKKMEREGTDAMGKTMGNESTEKNYKAGFLKKLRSLFKV